MIGDHHLALVKAIRKVMIGAAYQLSSAATANPSRRARQRTAQRVKIR
ncbi:hypothetical protein ABZ585_21165 [Streptomyces vietnamensis]